MEASQLYEEYKTQFIQNCVNLQNLDIIKNFDQYQKLIQANQLLLKHIAIQMNTLGSKKSLELNTIKLQKDKFSSLKKKYEIEKSKRTLQNQDFNHQNYNKQLQQSQKLNQCKSLLYQMEDNSISISQNLKQQTDKMSGMKSKLGSIGQIMSKANTLVEIMLSRQRRRQSIVTIVLIAIFLTIFMIKYCCI